MAPARWHEATLATALDDGEALLAARRVSLHRLASSASTRLGRPSVDAARRLGFPLPGRLFVLAVTTQRLLFFRTTALLARPSSTARSLPLDEVAAVRTIRMRGMRRTAVLLERGPIMFVASFWSGNLSELDAAFDRA